MNADKTDEQSVLLSLKDAATALGLRPATVKQYILRGHLAAVRLPHGHATRLFITLAELERYPGLFMKTFECDQNLWKGGGA